MIAFWIYVTSKALGDLACDLRRAGAPYSIAGGGLLDATRKQRLAGDHEPLDLGGALVQLQDLGVPHQLLDRVLLDEAVAAIHLDGVGGDLHRGVRGLERRLACEDSSVLRLPWSSSTAEFQVARRAR